VYGNESIGCGAVYVAYQEREVQTHRLSVTDIIHSDDHSKMPSSESCQIRDRNSDPLPYEAVGVSAVGRGLIKHLFYMFQNSHYST
jgi:hypothetical protein